jgi:hypothetical protein
MQKEYLIELGDATIAVKEAQGRCEAHTAENPEIKITKKSNVHPAAAANPPAAHAQNESAAR